MSQFKNKFKKSIGSITILLFLCFGKFKQERFNYITKRSVPTMPKHRTDLTF